MLKLHRVEKTTKPTKYPLIKFAPTNKPPRCVCVRKPHHYYKNKSGRVHLKWDDSFMRPSHLFPLLSTLPRPCSLFLVRFDSFPASRPKSEAFKCIVPLLLDPCCAVGPTLRLFGLSKNLLRCYASNATFFFGRYFIPCWTWSFVSQFNAEILRYTKTDIPLYFIQTYHYVFQCNNRSHRFNRAIVLTLNYVCHENSFITFSNHPENAVNFLMKHSIDRLIKKSNKESGLWLLCLRY